MAVEKLQSNSSHSLARFKKIVLGWDYLALLLESKKSGVKCKPVRNTYKNISDYIDVYEPLLFEEVKSQIVQQDDEEEENSWEKGAASCVEAEGFYKVTMAVYDSFREKLSENDLLLVAEKEFKEGEAPGSYVFALVSQRSAGEAITLLTFLDGETKKLDEIGMEPSKRLLRMLHLLKTDGTLVWVKKICSLSTIMREYVALHSVGTLPFKDLILSASENFNCRSSEDQEWVVPHPLMRYLKDSMNDYQLDAIHAGLSRKRFVLIQGPPGTGKTQTILGLLSAVLHSTPGRVQSKGLSSVKHRAEMSIEDKYRHWTKASPWLYGMNPRDLVLPSDGDDGFTPFNDELKPEIVNANRKHRVHVLVCAPSNSALDEIVLRLLRTGIHDENDHVYNPRIVRVGVKPHHSVKAVSMDYIVEQKIAGAGQSTKQGAGGSRDRDSIRASVLDEAAIVFSTLSFSGSSLFTRLNRVFDVVIIDEAAQAVEPATLVPLAHGCRQVYLVGDPVQLPATVISKTAEKFGYGTSLFKRFHEAGLPVQMLKTQYRMHPEISIFPSQEFYENSLENGPLVEKQTQRSWHEFRCFGPFSFFDIDGVEEQPAGSGSYINEDEANFIVTIYRKLAGDYPELKSGSQLAVISPYSSQIKLLKEKFRTAFGEKLDQFVDINTVDGFQGREKDIAIFSCVRSNEGKGIGFVSDFRRMNVGITRARSSVLVVGSASTLMQNKHWSNLVNAAKERGCYFKVTKPHSSFFSDSNLETLKSEKRLQLDKKLEQMETEAADHEANLLDDQPQDYDINDDGGGNEDD